MRVVPRGRSCGCDPCNDWRAIVKELWNKYQNVVKSVIVNGTRLSPDGNGDVTMNLKTINRNGLLGTGNINISADISTIGQMVNTDQYGTMLGMQIAIDGNPNHSVDIVYLSAETGRSVEEGMTQKAITDALNTKQATLVSGTNIKTINGTSLLGSGDITISGGSSLNWLVNPSVDLTALGWEHIVQQGIARVSRLSYKTNASDTVSTFVMTKYYYGTGQNEDGAMTQKAITDALNLKLAIASMYTTSGVNAQTSTNPVALKDFVNSSVATNTANYISNNGSPFTSLAQLQAYSGTVTNNDYAFVVGTDTVGNTTYTRYKATVNGSNVTWAEEYVLNNSSFTAAQWNAINSGITSGKVSTYDGYASLIAAKQDALVSGTNIKTINNQSLLGSGNISISGGSAVWGGITGTLSDQTDLANALALKANTADLATVATTGSYYDLTNQPVVRNVMQSLTTENTNKPLLLAYPSIADSGSSIIGPAYRNNSIYANPSTGVLNALALQENGVPLSDKYQTKHSTVTVSIATSAWNSSTKEATVNVTGATASNDIIVSPASASYLDYANAQIRAISQASGTVTFKCETVPTSSISVVMVIL